MTSEHEQIAAALPGYEIGEEIGRGTWGVVLRAKHRELGRQVAIKQLPHAFAADPSVRGRFKTEARILASLDHPHIVPIHEYVEQDGLCLLVMDMLSGGTVWTRFKTTGLTMGAACSVALATAEGLGFAHKKGILHRDIKPENLLLTDEGTVKVSDFGIAKIFGGDSTMATVKREVLGTPAYISPEQAMAEELTPATDLYALGTVLFELLSGRLPFDDNGNEMAHLILHVAEEPFQLDTIARDVPRGLCDVVMKCLARDPKRRYRSAEELGIAIADVTTAAWGPGWHANTGMPVKASELLSAHLSAPLNSRPTTGETTGETRNARTMVTSDAGDASSSRIVRPDLPNDHKTIRVPSTPLGVVPWDPASVVDNSSHRSYWVYLAVVSVVALGVVLSLLDIGPLGGLGSKSTATATTRASQAVTTTTISLGPPKTSPTATLAAYSTFPVPNTHPTGITSGPGGALWFTEQATDSIWSVTPGGTPHMVKQLAPGSSPFRIIQGPDGNMWFTKGYPDSNDPTVLANNGVGRLSPDGTELRPISLPGSNPIAITIGPDQNIWVTGYKSNRVYRITREGDRIGDYPVPNNPNSIVTGPDGKLWITEALGADIHVLSLDGSYHDFPVIDHPTTSVIGPDGKTQWVISHDSGQIQSITTDGVTSRPLPVGGAPGGLVLGPDGNLWYTDLDGYMVVVIAPVVAPDGHAIIVKQIPVTGGGMPFAITTNGPKGSVWFTVVNDQASIADAVDQVTGLGPG